MKNSKVAVFLFVVFAISCIGLNAYSQNKSWQAGVKLGITNSVFAKDYQGYTDNRVGMSGGVFGNYCINNFFAVGADVLYFQQGAANVNPYTTKYFPTTSNVCMHTLDVPILLNLSIPGIENVKPKLILGNGFGYNVATTAYNRILVDVDPPLYIHSKDNISDRFNAFDFGGIVGAGVDFKADKLMMTIEARYRLGYMNMNTRTFDYFSPNTASLHVGVGF